MKWIFYVMILIYMLYRAVYGLEIKQKKAVELTIEPIDYGSNKNYLLPGSRKSITCKGTNRNQMVEWIDPSGHIVPRITSNRVYAQEHFVPSSSRARIPATILKFNRTTVKDTGTWTCRFENNEKFISLCIIDPAEFLNTPAEVTSDTGRSITLSCQAQGEPEPEIFWNRDGEILREETESKKYKVMTKYNNQGFEGLLTIMFLESSDSGNYTCHAVQNHPDVEDCKAISEKNVTLYVNFAPTFEDGNGTTIIPVKENEGVQLVCAAKGYPPPLFRWFKYYGEVLIEYSKRKIKLQDDESKAILELSENSTDFGSKYKCLVENKYGVIEKDFILIKLEAPKEPNEVTMVNATSNSLDIEVRWETELFVFSVDGLTVQYMKVENSTQISWEKSSKVNIMDSQFISMGGEDYAGFIITIRNLQKETEYQLRLCAFNVAGNSPWSEPLFANTTGETQPEEIANDDKDYSEVFTAEDTSGIFYGLFFTAGVIILAVGCMFAVRLV